MSGGIVATLVSLLKQEADSGFLNTTQTEGLEKWITEWCKSAQEANLDSDFIQQVAAQLSGYDTVSLEYRSDKITNIIQIIREKSSKTTRPARKEKKTNLASPPTNINAIATFSGSSNLGLDAPLTVLHGVGSKNAERLQKLNLFTLNDLLHHYPRRYEDYSKLMTIDQLLFDIETTVIGIVENVQTKQIPKRKIKITEALINDNTGWLRLTWFNQPWIENQLKPKMTVAVSGKIENYLGKPVINNPQWEKLDKEQINTNRIVPIYPLTAHMSQQWLRKIIFKVITYWAPRIHDYLPENIIRDNQLIPLSDAILQIHFPDSEELLASARDRLAFDEIFVLQLGLLSQKYQWQQLRKKPIEIDKQIINSLIETLPFSLTDAQFKVIEEIRDDFSNPYPMNRLLQGDVGSGKTIIAAASSFGLAKAGYQTALMAPTSILAEQHFQSLTEFLCEKNLGKMRLQESEIAILTGDTNKKDRVEIQSGLESGRIKILIGTHALIEDVVQFHNLELVIIDEQHRFGVKQRAALQNKGANPNLLVMTATPIPRSMALTIYGDLDISVLDELPPGRKDPITKLVLPQAREKMYSFIRNEIKEGRQAFIIYPLVEQSSKEQTKAAVDEHHYLQKNVFPDLNLGLMHGRLKPDEKERVMRKFKNRQHDILISTSVVEVGVDVPNASVMVIEGANRFGLAQLHQFRGRVGRGSDQSYCFLVPETEDAGENERLSVMCHTNDGFVLADQDLQQRGPGDFLGTRQSGFSELKIARITDSKLIEKARSQAGKLMKQDPVLEQDQHQLLKQLMNFWWAEKQGENN
jgi:ATP-dependent DNA helicase RecG